jgi:hypothetical protein
MSQAPESKSANVARLHTGWALQHLLEARKFQHSCNNSNSAIELSMTLQDAIEELAANDPNWAAAVQIEQDLIEANLI